MKKIKCILLTAISGIATLFAGAQVTGGRSVQGQLLSARQPVESATLELVRAKDTVVRKIAVSDKSGAYEWLQVIPGSYRVRVQALGYQPYLGQVFQLPAGTAVYKMPDIVLVAASKELGTVTVTSQKPLIEQKIDRTIVNVEASVTNVGTTALDVLEKSPGIMIDKDGNISLKGKTGVQVFIDGRPSYLSGQDLANYLRNMQSAQMDQIEIMTNPPAKYDASGDAGIINIKTKKNKQVGYNGSVTAGYGQGVYSSTNESLNLNYRNGKLNLFGNLNYGYRDRFQELSIQRKFIDASTKVVQSYFTQQNDLRTTGHSYNGKIGMDYFASPKTTLGFVWNGGNSRNFFGSNSAVNIADGSEVPQSMTRGISDNQEHWDNSSLNLNMRQLLGTKGAELTADLDYIHYNAAKGQQLTNAYFDPSGAPLSGARPDTLLGNLPQDITIYSARMDYLLPLKNNARFEAGWKSSFVRTDANALYDSLINNAQVPDLNRSNHFVYDENINAAYVNYSRPLSKKITAQFGLRMEHTHADGKQLTTHINFTRDYVQLFPTVYLQYQPNDKNSWVLNYGKRISRPDYESLNPFATFIDRYTYEQGNPDLSPQFSHNIELSHTYRNFLTTTLNFTQTTDIIQQVLEQDNAKNQTYVKESNIASQRQFGLSVNANFPVRKGWMSNIYANLFNNHFHGIINGDMVTVGSTTAMFNVMQQFKFNKGWSAEASGFYRTEALQGVFRVGGMGVCNIGLGKQVLKGNGSIRLNVRDIFWTQRAKGSI
ncbi:MAG TPA: TonB-dependent receptor, partial [Sediminibacterium sp.]|nr:TonB-dependent receptor [Sediminibacterium sp.]